MARTVNFDFTQGGGSVIAEGTLTLSSTQNWDSPTSTVIPSGTPIELVGGVASIPNVEPTPTASDGWRYHVQLETPDRKIHTWIVSVPAGTTPIDFKTLPKLMSMTLPLGATGAQLQMWIDSVRSHAAAANANALNALGATSSLNTRVTALESGGGGGGGGTVFPGTVAVVRKVGTTWPARPTSSADTVVAWQGPAPAPPIVTSGTAGMRNNIDVWWRTS